MILAWNHIVRADNTRMSLTQLTDCAVSSNFGTRLDTEAPWQGQLVLCDLVEGWRVGGGRQESRVAALAYLLHYWAPEARTSAACLSRLLMLIQLTRALTVANCDQIFDQFSTQLDVFFTEPRTFEGYFMWALGNVGRLPSDSDDCCS